MNNFHYYRETRIIQKSTKQRSVQKVNQFRAPIKNVQPVDSVIYNNKIQKEIRIKTEPQSRGTSQNKKFSEFINQVNKKQLTVSRNVKQERYNKYPKFQQFKGFDQHQQDFEQSLDTPTFRNRNGHLCKTLEIENQSNLIDFQVNSFCHPTFNVQSKEQSPNKEQKNMAFPKCIFFCDVKKARNFFQIQNKK